MTISTKFYLVKGAPRGLSLPENIKLNSPKDKIRIKNLIQINYIKNKIKVFLK